MVDRQIIAVLLIFVWTGLARADEVRYYEKDGVTYCETRCTVQQRVPESRMEERTKTVYREELATETRKTQRDYWAPVTDYRWESFWVGRWNPLAEPYLAYKYVPHTRWEKRTEVVDVPMPVRRMVPETRTVRQPVAGFKTVQREEVVSLAVVGGGGPKAPYWATGTPMLAQRPQIGGLSRLDNGPPRRGPISAPAPTVWR